MQSHKALVHLGPDNGTVNVDGTRLKGLRGLTISAGADEVPTLTVELLLHSALIDGEYVVQVPEDSAAALIALGWTPPAPAQP
jgi:hypothetical protein